MRILFGTDFSSEAAAAADVAANLAARRGSRLLLVHALDSGLLSLLDQNRRDYLLGRLRKRLSSEAERLRAVGGKVEEKLASGSPQRALAELADKTESNLIMVSSGGTPYPERWLAGSVAERIAQNSAVPTLALRKAEPLMAWARGEQTLNVFVCYDFSASSDAAIQWVASLMKIGPCRVTVTYVSWPPQEAWRLGLGSSGSLAKNTPEVQKLLEEDLRERCRTLLPGARPKLRVIGSWGDMGVQLVELAKTEGTDLIVAGTNQRTGLNRFWLGSVSREILHRAPMNVVCVPMASSNGVSDAALPKFKRVLVSTDLSKLGNKAIPYGYGAIQRGGEMLLVHVVPPRGSRENKDGEAADPQAELKRKLMADLERLLPTGSQAKAVRARVEVVEHEHPAVGVCQAAERFRAELICMASQGRVGLQKKLLGSVTESVLRRSKRPVLVIRE